MNITEVLGLIDSHTDIENAQLAEVFNQLKTITSDYKANKITAQEYFELIHDVNTEEAIITTANELRAYEDLKVIVDAVLAIAAAALTVL
jgi:hypothetical protein